MKLETPVKPGMDSLHAASRISVEKYSISLCWLSLLVSLVFVLESVRGEWPVFGDERAGVCSSSASVEGQDRKGSELGRPWVLTPRAWVFHVTLCLIPLYTHGQNNYRNVNLLSNMFCNDKVSPKISYHKISCLRSPSKRQTKIKVNEWWKKQLGAPTVQDLA